MQAQQTRNLHARALRTKDGALELLVKHRETEQVQLHVVLPVGSNRGRHDGAALRGDRTSLFNHQIIITRAVLFLMTPALPVTH